MPSLSKRLFRKLPVARSTRAYAFALTLLPLPPSRFARVRAKNLAALR